jgi:hypothetical protein
MATQALQRRVASPPLSMPVGITRQHLQVLPRLWPNLPVQTQQQIARKVAELMRRIEPARRASVREIACADRPARR